MRAVATCLFLLLLLLGGAAPAQAQLATPNCDVTPLVLCKKVRIFNNEPAVGGKTIYVVFARGFEKIDEWLVGLCGNACTNSGNFPTTQVYRYYVGCKLTSGDPVCDGIQPQHSVEVTIPFYTQLKVSANPTTDNDVFADWFNGNRIFFYDDHDQIVKRITDDGKNLLAPVGKVPCVTTDGAGSCTDVSVFKSAVALPADDRAQLMEYTFTSVVKGTNDARPWSLITELVNYNISYVDQVYLPVTMAVVNNPIPYIGTTMALATFRQKMNNFLTDYPQWPIYRATDLVRPRIPGPNVTFADLIPPQNTELFFPGASGQIIIDKGLPSQKIFASAFPDPNTVITNMRDVLFPACRDRPSTAAICTNYKTVIDFFTKNYNNNKAKCDSSLPDKPEPNNFLAHVYGWVPFESKCPGGNNLANDPDFNKVQGIYIHGLQYPFDTNGKYPNNAPGNPYSFNPYTQLVHSPTYLGMSAAYAFSVDDAFSFLQFIGDGLILTFGPGCGKPQNLKPCRSLNKNERVQLSMGDVHGGMHEWASATYACDGTGTPFTLDLKLGPVIEFYPQISPCVVTLKDSRGKQYTLPVLRPLPPEGTQPTTNVAKDCSSLPANSEILGWCNRTTAPSENKILPTDKVLVGITGPVVLPDSNSHDFNNDPCAPDPAQPADKQPFLLCGRSDILWRNSGGGVAAWLIDMDGSHIFKMPTFGSLPNTWTIVGQRDFNADGFTDLLWRNNNGGLGIWLINANLADPVLGRPSVGTPPPGSDVAGTGDFNGDKKGDILFRNGSVVFLWLITNATTDPIVPTQVVLPNKSVDWAVAGVGDFNGDGKSDILWYNSTSRMVEIWLIDASKPNPVFSMGIVGKLDSPWVIAGTGDFDGDLKSDILITSPNPDGSTNVGAWLMNGAALQPSPQNGAIQNPVGIGVLPKGWTIVETGDLDGDRHSDLILQFIDNTQNIVSVGAWRLDARNSGATNLGVPIPVILGRPLGIGSLPIPDWQMQTANSD